MAPPHSGSVPAVPPGDAYPTLALSLIRIHGYRAPDPDVLNAIVRDAAAAPAGDEVNPAAPVDTAAIGHLDRLVRAAAAAGRLQRD